MLIHQLFSIHCCTTHRLTKSHPTPNTGPVLQTYFDADIISFYSQYYGSEYLWGLRAKRQYKVRGWMDMCVR